MKYIIVLFLPLFVMADSLESLYEKVKNSSTYKSKNKFISSQVEAVKASVYQDNWSVGSGVGYANVRDGSNSGNEFTLFAGKEFNLNNSKIDMLIQNNNKYYGLKSNIVENRLKLKLWQHYGNYCISQKALQAKAELASVYQEILLHIKKGVEYGEFDLSKEIMAELLFENLNLQISSLENSLKSYESKIKVIVPFDGAFECRGLEVNIEKLFDIKYSILFPMLESKVESGIVNLNIVQQNVSSLKLNATYSNEIDTDRYMLNFSLPLNFGKKNDAKKARAMDNLSSLSYALEALKNSYKYESEALKDRIAIYRKYFLSTEVSIKKGANILIQQSNMRFRAGEESFISMLKATETKQQMLELILNLKIQRHNAVAKYMYDYAINPREITK